MQDMLDDCIYHKLNLDLYKLQKAPLTNFKGPFGPVVLTLQGPSQMFTGPDEITFKRVLHLLPKISMFCALSQNNQQLFEK